MASEDELLAKLSRWIEAQDGPISVFTVIETGDRELLAAYVLVVFRAAARQAVVDRFDRMVDAIAPGQVRQSDNVVLRLFDGLSSAWKLSDAEQGAVLGLGGPGEVSHLRGVSEAEVPIEVIERVAILLDIFTAINAILQEPERSDGWMRMSNKSPLFAGKSAIEVMEERGISGLRAVRAYLWSNL